MIDTVTISTNSFSVKSKNLLKIVTYNYDATKFEKPRYLFTYFEDIEPCYAFEAKGVCDGFRINIYPTFDKGIPLIGSLHVSFEISTIFDGHNLNPIVEKQVPQIKGKIEKALEKIGIVADLQTFKIKRLDFSKDILLDHQLEEYTFILNYLKYIRSGSSSLNKDSLYKGNKSYVINIYDKGKKHEDKYNIVFKKFEGRTLARFEIRLMKLIICDRVLKKAGLLNNIFAFCSCQGWKKLKKVFNNEIKQLFYLNMKIGTIECQDDLMNAELLINEGEKANSVAALLTLSKHYNTGDFEQLINILNVKNKPGTSQYRKKVIQKIVKYNLCSTKNALKYKEMKEKLLFDPELKSHRRKYVSTKAQIISLKEEFLVTKPDYFIDRKKAKNKYQYVEIASLFWPKESENENR